VRSSAAKAKPIAFAIATIDSTTHPAFKVIELMDDVGPMGYLAAPRGLSLSPFASSGRGEDWDLIPAYVPANFYPRSTTTRRLISMRCS
jgi:hypothetical protein